MFELGIIGYGSMGSMLLNGFMSKGVITQDQVIVSNRTRSKLDGLKTRWPRVAIADSNPELARQSKIVLIAVKPHEIKPLLDEIAGSIGPDTHLVSITTGVMMKDMESMLPCKISKIIPSMTMEVCTGTSLVSHNDQVDSKDAGQIERLFGSISAIRRIDEKNFEVATELTSCGPGLFSAMVQEFAKAGMRHGTLSREEAEQMALSTIYGTSKLLYEKEMGTDELIARVATPGGITEEGVKILREDLPRTFDRLFDRSAEKREIVKAAIREQFYGSGENQR